MFHFACVSCLSFINVLALNPFSYDLTNLFDLVALKNCFNIFFLLPVIVHFSFSFFTNTVVKSGTMFSPSFMSRGHGSLISLATTFLSLFLDQGSKTVVHL